MRTLLLLFISINLGAQNEKEIWSESNLVIEYQLEKNENVNFEYINGRKRIQNKNSSVALLKLDLFEEYNKPEKYLTESLLKSLKENRIFSYSLDSNIKLSYKEITKAHQARDSLPLYDDLSNKKPYGYNIVQTDKSNEINSFKVLQNWKIFDSKIEITTKEIVPVINYISKENKIRKELYKITFLEEELGKNDFLNTEKYTWIKLTVDYFKLDEMQFNQNQLASLREILWENPLNHKTPIYDMGYSILTPSEKLSTNYFEENILNNSTDTIITFNPETYEEKIQTVLQGGYTFSDIIGFKLYQLWIWNIETGVLSSIALGIAPVAKTKYIRTLYNIKFE